MEPSEKLKPCPFCGSKALVGQTLDYAWYAMCEKDFCCKLDSYWKTEAEAIAAWNTRDQRALNEAAAKERAKVVAWLRGGAGTDTTQLPRSTRALFLRGLHGYADAIEQGAHHDPA